MSTPAPQKLFDAIRKKSISGVKSYFSDGGKVDVLSAKDRPPLAELIYVLLESNDPDDYFSNQFQQEEEETDDIKLIRDLGNVLLENGSNYSARAGNTNRSVQISQLVRIKYPQIHKEWQSFYNRMLIQKSIQDVVQDKPDVVKKQRKI